MLYAGEQTMKSSVAKRSKSTVLKRSVVIAGHKTSVSLEDEFWNGLREIAKQRGGTVSDLLAAIDADRQNTANLSSAIRLFVLGFYQEQHAKNHSRRQLLPRQNVRPFVEADHLADAQSTGLGLGNILIFSSPSQFGDQG